MKRTELTPHEKDQAIEYILSKGLTRPKSLWRHLVDMYRAIGLRHLFLDTVQPALMAAAFMAGFVALNPLPPEQYRHAALFAAAPVFFIFAVLLTEAAERRNGALYELKMTCKYTLLQITAFRLLGFSLAGTVLCTLAGLSGGFPDVHAFFRALSLSLCSLFLCSFQSLFVMRRFNRKWIHAAPVLLWAAIGVLPAWLFGRQWESFLTRIPVAVTLTIAAVSFALFLRELKTLIRMQTREVAWHAAR
jgi:hypothetical protein